MIQFGKCTRADEEETDQFCKTDHEEGGREKVGRVILLLSEIQESVFSSSQPYEVHLSAKICTYSAIMPLGCYLVKGSRSRKHFTILR